MLADASQAPLTLMLNFYQQLKFDVAKLAVEFLTSFVRDAVSEEYSLVHYALSNIILCYLVRKDE